ncbi:hypothetical protein [Haloglomus litoreum]|nr:hypothetical protein [Haloglomus sp. DT116]
MSPSDDTDTDRDPTAGIADGDLGRTLLTYGLLVGLLLASGLYYAFVV